MNTAYTYSKKNSIVTIIVILILGLLFVSNIYKAYYNNDRIDMIVFIVFTLILIFVLGIVVFNRLIPAINADIILEFNEDCVIDHLRNITINWHDIKAIDFKRTRSSSLIMIQIKWESDYGSAISVSLRWVDGKDIDIYNTALSYFNRLGNQEHLIEE